MSTSRDIKAGVPQGSVLSPTLYNLYINDTHQIIGVNLALFADGISLYATENNEGYVLRKLQRGLNSMAALCKRCNIKINEEKTRAVCFSHWIRRPESLLTLNGQNIPIVNSVRYLGLILDKKITWRLYIETFVTKAYRTFIRLYSLFKSDRLSTKSKLALHKALIGSKMTYACPVWEFAADGHLMKLLRLQNKVHRTIGKFSRNTWIRDMHISLKIPYVYD
jgi:hypothetical protein